MSLYIAKFKQSSSCVTPTPNTIAPVRAELFVLRAEHTQAACLVPATPILLEAFVAAAPAASAAMLLPGLLAGAEISV